MENKELKKLWVDLRNNNTLTYDFFKNFYYSKCKECKGEGEFIQAFPFYFNSHKEQIIENIDKDLEIMKIFNKKGELIKFT